MLINDFSKLLVLPNIWTEVDNLLHSLKGGHKWKYIQNIKYVIGESSEKYIQSKVGTDSQSFISLGLTDSLILELSKDCEYLITGDSALSDYAKAAGIKVYDLVEMRNIRFKG